MLSLLHRHVLKEIVVATAMAMGLFIFVLLLGNVIKDVAGLLAAGKLDAMMFFRLLGLLIPYVAVWALPLGVLTGTLIALGRLSSNREITAMKASGISLYRIAAPVFLIAFMGMILGAFINLQYGPTAKVAYKQMMADAITENPVGFIEEKRFINEFPGLVIYMGDRDGKKMKDFWIWELDDANRVKLFSRAAEGELNYDKGSNTLTLILRNGTVEKRDGDDPEALAEDPMRSLFFGELPIELPLGELFGEKSRRKVKTKEMTLVQLMELRRSELEEEAEAGTGMTKQRLRVQMHIQKNFAMSFSVFSLAIFGIPLAIQVGRKETYANLAIALVIAMTYYFLMIVVSWLEEVPALRPDLLVWVPNLIFQSIGLFMMYRASRR